MMFNALMTFYTIWFVYIASDVHGMALVVSLPTFTLLCLFFDYDNTFHFFGFIYFCVSIAGCVLVGGATATPGPDDDCVSITICLP